MTELRKSTESRRAGLCFAGALIVFGAVAIAAMTSLAKPNAETVAAIFPLWWSEQQSLLAAASAGAAIIRMGGLSSIVVVQLPAHDGAARLHDAGAWIALDPLALDACFSKLNFKA